MRSARWIGGAWLLTALLPAPAGGASDVPRVPADPLFALWQHTAGTALEDDSPQVVIYQDGTVIARQARGTDPRTDTASPSVTFVTKRLALADLNMWYDDILAIVVNDELKTLYDVATTSSAPTAVFHFQAGGRGVLVRVHGLSDAALSPFGTLLTSDAEEVPGRLLRVFQDSRRLNLDAAAPWKPPLVAVQVAPAPRAVRDARPWPASWPNPLMDENRSSGTSGPVTLNAADPAVSRFAQQPGWHPFVIGGEVRLARFRPVFPGEAEWRRQFELEAERRRRTEVAGAREQRAAERGRMPDAPQPAEISNPPPSIFPVVAPNPRVEPPPVARPDVTSAPFPIAPPPPDQKSR